MPQSTTNLQQDKGLLALFKGDSGEGKSTAALSFPTPYVFDFDKKMPWIARKHYLNKEIHWDTFDSVFEIDNILNSLIRDCPYETLIADSFTGLANLCVSSVGLVKGDSVPEILKRVQKTKSGDKQIEMMGIDYYSAEDRYCTYFVEQLKKLWARDGNPKHVIFIAHVITTESAPDLKTKIVTRTRSIVSKGRKVAAWLPTEFDNVYLFGHMQPDLGSMDTSIRRIVITEAFGEDSAKCSFRLPSIIDVTNDTLYDEYRKITDGDVVEAELVEGSL
jgi:AAA domain